MPNNTKNTISGNSIGIYLSELGYDATPTIQNNNLQNNTDYNFYLDASNNVDVSNNWWGTTNTTTISQSIYDFNDDFNLGTVRFQPILTSPNSNAPAPPTPTPTPDQESQQAEQEIVIGGAIAAAVILAGLGLLIYLIKRK